MKIEELGDGLWRWVAFHDEWKEDVGSLYVETGESVWLVDPLVPGDAAQEFLRQLDADIERAGRRVDVLLTVYWHVRSTAEVARRYGARVWAPARSALPAERRIGIAPERVRPGDTLPGGIEAHASGRAAELVYRLPEHGALVAGDVLLGDPLRICPAGWVGKGGREAVRDALQPLAEAQLEAVLVSHGTPVLDDASGRLAAALVVR